MSPTPAQLEKWSHTLWELKAEIEESVEFSADRFPPDYAALVHMAWKSMSAATLTPDAIVL